ncbi:LLM class flavin-dependent oxidoreductase [Nocardia sp. NBC_01009]|uniref:LLM class flavin-dependent oxidoreductase n=1 Tax=Nocardia sp. NBC_01009 TaxID=2975996 RepID=UPI003870623E|nr:LLM class flavin-dependent oxidoreductase [Nocardia sp. NBC_01009]
MDESVETSGGLRLGIAPHRLWTDAEVELDGVVETARTAEQLGFDHVIASSHVPAGELGVTPDPLVMLSAIAGATSRIGLAGRPGGYATAEGALIRDSGAGVGCGRNTTQPATDVQRDAP